MHSPRSLLAWHSALHVASARALQKSFATPSRWALVMRIAFFGSPEEMSASDDQYIRDFLGGS